MSELTKEEKEALKAEKCCCLLEIRNLQHTILNKSSELEKLRYQLTELRVRYETADRILAEVEKLRKVQIKKSGGKDAITKKLESILNDPVKAEELMKLIGKV